MITKDDPVFSIENQFQLYCQRVGLKRDKVSATQWTETRRAFFGAAGQLLIMLRNDLSLLSEDDGVETMIKMLDEVGDFWNAEAIKDKE